MNAPSNSRQQILDRVRAATQEGTQGATASALGSTSAANEIPRDYIRRGALNAEARLALLIERLREYDAEVAECEPEELPTAIAAQLAASGRHIFAAPAGLPAAWLATGFDWKIDGSRTAQDKQPASEGLSVEEIEKTEGVVTAAFCAVADSGTIVLHHAPTEGRRVLTLLPDWHLCILCASQVVETLPEYFDLCSAPSEIPALVTWISGPSATADIEMTRIKGVHGPRFLHVLLVRDDVHAATPIAVRNTARNED